MGYVMSFAAKRRLKEIRLDEVKKDVRVLKSKLNSSSKLTRMNRDDDLKWLEIAQKEVKELNQWLRNN